MTEHKIDDRVLVPGKVIGYDSDGYLLVAFVGAELEFRPTDLRPDPEGADTGRPITADDVRDAHHAAWGVPNGELFRQSVAEYLNHIAQGEERASAVSEPLPIMPPEVREALAHYREHEYSLDLLDRPQRFPRAATLVRWLLSVSDEVTGDSAERASAVSEPEQKSESSGYTLDDRGRRVDDGWDHDGDLIASLQGDLSRMQERGDQVANAARGVNLRNGMLVGIDALTEAVEAWEDGTDDGREFIRLDGGWLRNMIDRFAAGTMSADAVLSELTASISPDFWNSPRSWSLPAPPPDDVTVEYRVADGPQPDSAHPDERPVTCTTRHRDQVETWFEHWRTRWSDARIETRTGKDSPWIVEGEPPAPEPEYAVGNWVRVPTTDGDTVTVGAPALDRRPHPDSRWDTRTETWEPAPEPPRFERGFYRLARDLDLGHVRFPAGSLVFLNYEHGDTQVIGLPTNGSKVTPAALAAAGPERVEDGS